MKARELHCDKYLEEDLSKYIFTDEVVFKGEKWEEENGLQKAKNMLLKKLIDLFMYILFYLRENVLTLFVF